MVKFFSPSLKAFYDGDARLSYMMAGTWPQDALAVTDEMWTDYIQPPPIGQVLGVGPTGRPVWVDAPPPPPLTRAQLAANIIASGCHVVSTATPSISATYALDDTTLDQIGSLARDTKSGMGFPNGASMFGYPDINGTPKIFSEVNIQNLYKALRDYTYKIKLYASNQTDVVPTQPTTIT